MSGGGGGGGAWWVGGSCSRAALSVALVARGAGRRHVRLLAAALRARGCVHVCEGVAELRAAAPLSVDACALLVDAGGDGALWAAGEARHLGALLAGRVLLLATAAAPAAPATGAHRLLPRPLRVDLRDEAGAARAAQRIWLFVNRLHGQATGVPHLTALLPVNDNSTDTARTNSISNVL